MSWKQVSLADVAEQIQYGYTASATDEAIGPQFLRITDIVPDSINWGTVPYCPITEKDAAKYKIEKGDIVIARTGNTTGYAKLIRQDVNAVFASYLIRIKLDTRLAEPGFVGRLVESPSYKAFVDGVKGGAAQGNANAKTLALFSFKLPPLPVQQKIASILSAYDDLLDNNRKRVALLEKAARLLYEEWFVRLQFPGYEHTPVVDGVPEGWKRMYLYDIADPTYGFAFKSNLFNEDEGLPVVRIRDVPSGVSKTFTTEDVPADKLLSNGDLLIGMDGEFHMNLWAGGTAALNQRVVWIKSKGEVNDYLIMQALKAPIAFYQSTITGTTVAHLGAKHLKEIQLLIPNHALLELSNQQFAPMKQQLITLSIQNQKLQQARDLLLPRLMSGELAV